MNRNEIRIIAESCEVDYCGPRDGPTRQMGGNVRNDPCTYDFSGLDYGTLLNLAIAATKTNYRLIYGSQNGGSKGGWQRFENQVDHYIVVKRKVETEAKKGTSECRQLRHCVNRLFDEKIKPLQEKLDAKRREQVEMYYIALSADKELEKLGRVRADIDGGQLFKGDDPAHLSAHYYR